MIKSGFLNQSVKAILIGCFLSISAIVSAKDQSLKFEISIHPKLGSEECSKLPTLDSLAQEVEFPKALSKGWVSLQSSNFDKKDKDYPCHQNIVVTFPNEKEFHQFLAESNGMIQYPFYSGADYWLFTEIFKYVVKSGDKKAYKILLLKDTRNSASEELAPLYAKLRKNSRVFGEVFETLNKEQKLIAVQVQYDFNLLVEEQKLKNVKGMSAVEKRGVLEFNKMIEEWGKSGDENVREYRNKKKK